MQHGFLIDHTRCIGCHACTVACKAENQVPVGDFRTWVKYTETGKFPAVKRGFAVLRCNHCTKAPCVTICPVTALHKRPDGIVDLDRDVCIGCRACMQACPYDAIYLNEDTGSAEKCHFCAHRVEKNLLPACVNVCPTEAIVPFDVHDKDSPVKAKIQELGGIVRRPEQGTGPNVFYVGVDPVALRPGEAERPSTYLSSQRPGDKPEPWPKDVATAPATRTVLDVGHKVEWGHGVAAYMVTKGIAGGVGLLAPFAGWLGLKGWVGAYAPEVLALAFTAITTVLLVEDLMRPRKFFTLLTRGNTKSWLTRGAWILIAYTVVATLALLARFAGFGLVADVLRWPMALVGAATAGYTAYLFKQCEGRDLWQEPGLLGHLLVQAVMCGALTLLPLGGGRTLAIVAAVAIAAHGAWIAETALGRRSTDNARQGQGFLFVVRLWGWRAIATVPALVAASLPLVFVASPVAWVAAMAGLYVWEWAFVRAGQLPPLS